MSEKKKRVRPYKRVDKRKEILLSPQRVAFIKAYTDPKSPTFTNAYRSALAVGFKENYASQILARKQKWLQSVESQINDEKRLRRAEEGLDEVQNLNIRNEDGKIDPAVLNAKVKVHTWLAERLDKLKYSTRTENATIVKHIHEIDEETKARLDNLLS